jgi:hypothetical protein
MNKTPREIRSYDYVNHPYQRVRDALQKEAPAVFQQQNRQSRGAIGSHRTARGLWRHPNQGRCESFGQEYRGEG